MLAALTAALKRLDHYFIVQENTGDDPDEPELLPVKGKIEGTNFFAG